jgi:beta-lactamase class A
MAKPISIALALVIITGTFGCETVKKVFTVLTVTHNKPVADTILPSPKADTSRTDTWLADLLKASPEYFKKILANQNSLRLQIIYTKIDRQADNTPVFSNYYYHVNPHAYFYPASTVKMPVALLALQKLNELNIKGLDKNTTCISEAAYSKQTPVYNNPTTPDGRPNIAQYIKKIFLVSDNDAYNRLYEFLGQQYINEALHRKGFNDAAILHRLDIAMTEDENRHTNPLKFIDAKGKIVYQQDMLFSNLTYPQRNDSIGKAYYSNNSLVNNPLDFSKKNKLTLQDLQGLLQTALFPKSVPEKQRFNLTEADYVFVKKYMSQLPRETHYPAYDTANYWDSYVKFLLLGSEKNSMPPNKNFRIFNKVGDAYGFLTDVAYIVDFDNKVEFMLSATIYCNSDETLNDDNYDYDTVGFPFMKHLGEVLYNYELKRERKYLPDLSEFKLTYDK